MKPTLYEIVTRQIVDAIEAGAGSYRMPWHRHTGDLACAHNAVTGKAYRGVNVLTLWLTAEAKGYASGTWGTYQQWLARGAQVRRGEKSATAIFWKRLDEAGQEPLPLAEGEGGARVVARAFSLFNADQVDGYTPPVAPVLDEAERIAAAETFFAAVPATVTHGGNMACYSPAADTVQMPAFACFRSAPAYYATLAHELTHWSGHKARLDRDLSGRFGSASYAVEELVAELGAAFTAAALGLAVEPRTDHAPYIASWLKVLKADSRAIFTAAGRAQAAADYLATFNEPPG